MISGEYGLFPVLLSIGTQVCDYTPTSSLKYEPHDNGFCPVKIITIMNMENMPKRQQLHRLSLYLHLPQRLKAYFRLVDTFA